MTFNNTDARILRIAIIFVKVLSLFVFFVQNFAITYPGPPMPISAVFFAAIHSTSNFLLCIFGVRIKLLQKSISCALLFLSICILWIFLAYGFKILFMFLLAPKSCININLEGMKSFVLCLIEIGYRIASVILTSKDSQ